MASISPRPRLSPITIRPCTRRIIARLLYLPLCHILGRDIAVTLPLFTRLVPHFGEDSEDLPATLFEVAPTILFTVPRYLQKFAAQILVGIMNSSQTKRVSYELAMRLRDHTLGGAGMGRSLRGRRLLIAPCMRWRFVPS